jgi:hypothetical protein
MQSKITRMRVLIILFSFFISSKIFAQDSSIISFRLNQIKKIPCTYFKKEISGNQFYDIVFNSILAQDTFAIPSLVNLLTDTTRSKVKKYDSNTYYKKGDLALILINYIEWIPFATLTQSQWCLCCDCGNLPSGFMEYFGANRYEFQKKYRYYYASEERRKSIKQSLKGSKKKRSH